MTLGKQYTLALCLGCGLFAVGPCPSHAAPARLPNEPVVASDIWLDILEWYLGSLRRMLEGTAAREDVHAQMEEISVQYYAFGFAPGTDLEEARNTVRNTYLHICDDPGELNPEQRDGFKHDLVCMYGDVGGNPSDLAPTAAGD